MATPERFAQLVAAPRVSLAEGCVAIADHIGHPDPEPGVVARLDALAESVAGSSGPTPDLDGVARTLFVDAGFRGARAAYYDERNSLLDEVLTRGVGIPITLSIVVIEVAARLGVVATGVGMPGHFLVGDGAAPQRWLDAYDGGTWLDQAGAHARFSAIHGPEATFDPAYLRPTPPVHILARVINNLAGIHRGIGDRRALLRSLELRQQIPALGTTPRALVELAEAKADLGHIAEAIDVLEGLADRVDPRRREVLERRVAMLRATYN